MFSSSFSIQNFEKGMNIGIEYCHTLNKDSFKLEYIANCAVPTDDNKQHDLLRNLAHEVRLWFCRCVFFIRGGQGFDLSIIGRLIEAMDVMITGAHFAFKFLFTIDFIILKLISLIGENSFSIKS